MESLLTDEIVITVGDLVLKEKRALWKDKPVPTLTLAEYAILEILAMNAGNPVSFQDMYDATQDRPGRAVGEDGEGYVTAVRSILSRLRSKFKQVDPNFSVICPIKGVGYQWNP